MNAHPPQEMTLEQAYALAAEHFVAGRLQESEQICATILQTFPDHVESLNLTGAIAQKVGRHDIAAARFRQAIIQDDQQAGFHLHLGLSLHRLGRTDEAVAAVQAGLRLEPENPHLLQFQKTLQGRTHLNRASLLIDRGRIAEGIASLEKALAADPTLYEAHFNLANARRCTHTDQVRPMETLLDAAPTAGKIHLHFALGKAMADLARDPEAFRHYREGNRLKRAEITFDIDREEATLARFCDLFDPAFFATRAGWGFDGGAPLFIVSMPRTGSTLIEQVLASHPEIHGAGEVPFVKEALLDGLGVTDLGEVPRLAADLDRERSAAMGRAYMAALEASGKGLGVDKTLANFWLIGPLRLMLPKARFIHAVRTPEDAALSIYRQNFREGNAFAYDLTELGRYYRLQAAMMDHWSALFPGAILPVSYEQLTADLARETRRMLGFLGLAWDDRCLEFHKTERPVLTASATQVRQPLYRTSVGGWRRFEAELQPLIEALGDLASG